MGLEVVQAGLQGLVLGSCWQGRDLCSLCGGLVYSSEMWFPQAVQALAVDVMVPWQHQEQGQDWERVQHCSVDITWFWCISKYDVVTISGHL